MESNLRKARARAAAFAVLAAAAAVFSASIVPVASASTPRLAASQSAGVITVATDDYPAGGWKLVFDDAMNGAISEFHLAGVAGGGNLCADGSVGARAGLFEKIWGTARGAHWLGGEFGRTRGESRLIEASGVRARIAQFVCATDTLPGEVPTRLYLNYTIYHTGRMIVEAEWGLNELPVLGSPPYADNSWRLVLADRGTLGGAVDESSHVALVDNGLPGLPTLLFAPCPTFWSNGAALSLDDPATRARYFGAATMDLTHDLFAGIAGARLAGSCDPSNPYALDDSYRHVFLVDWSRPGPGTLADAALTSRDFARPDPLDGRSGAGRVNVGSLVTDDPADADKDGFAEGEGCYTLRAAANVVSWRLSLDRGRPGETIPFFQDPAFKITDFIAAHDSVILLSSLDGGVNWNLMIPGEDYRATTHAEEQEVGTNTRIVSLAGRFPPDPMLDIRLIFGEAEGIITATVFQGPFLTPGPGAIEVDWRMTEPRVYRGYEVSRREDGRPAWEVLTPAMIPDETGPTGRSYSWTDTSPRPDRRYWYCVRAYPYAGSPIELTSSEAVAAGAAANGGPANCDPAASGPALRASPNPFNPEVNFTVRVPDAAGAGAAGAGGAGVPAALELFNARGERVRSLVHDTRRAGEFGVSWDGRDDDGRELPSGIYFARLSAGTETVTEKVILMK